jgi:hypothetical protein
LNCKSSSFLVSALNLLLIQLKNFVAWYLGFTLWEGKFFYNLNLLTVKNFSYFNLYFFLNLSNQRLNLMKTKLILPLIAIILLSSCSSKFSLQKRRYNKGFYLDLGSNHSSQKKNNLRPAAHLEAKKAELAVKENAEPALKTAEQSEPLVMTLAGAEKPNINHRSSQPTAASKSDDDKAVASAEKMQKEEKTFRSLPIASVKGKEAHKAKADGNKILMIILSLFPILALIAIYMHDGSITLNFWIDLILHFLLLYWLFALLVVLDVINLG